MLALIIALLAKGIEALLPFDVIGASVIALFLGMIVNRFYKPNDTTKPGIRFTSKKILKFAIILLGASLNITTVLTVGKFSLTVTPERASAAALPSRPSRPSSMQPI